MGAFGSRFKTVATITVLLSVLGSAQRAWYRHCVAEAEKADAAQQSVAAEYKAQLARFHEEVGKLPPEGREIVSDFMKAQGGAVSANPIVLGLARFSKTTDESLEERVVSGAQAVAVGWSRTSGWLAYALWLALAFCLGFGVAGVVLGRDGWPARAGAASTSLADRWLFTVSIATAALFAVSGLNAWTAMPAAFYLAPAAMDFAGFFLRLQEASDSEPVVADVVGSLGAPAASAAVVTFFSILVG